MSTLAPSAHRDPVETPRYDAGSMVLRGRYRELGGAGACQGFGGSDNFYLIALRMCAWRRHQFFAVERRHGDQKMDANQHCGSGGSDGQGTARDAIGKMSTVDECKSKDKMMFVLDLDGVKETNFLFLARGASRRRGLASLLTNDIEMQTHEMDEYASEQHGAAIDQRANMVMAPTADTCRSVCRVPGRPGVFPDVAASMLPCLDSGSPRAID